MSSVTKQVKKYRNRLKIRDSERFADFGSLLGSLFSCFDNSVIVCPCMSKGTVLIDNFFIACYT